MPSRTPMTQRREASAAHRHARGARERLGAVDIGVGEVRERDAACGGELGAAVMQHLERDDCDDAARVGIVVVSAVSSSSGGASHSSAVAESHRAATTVAATRQRRSSPVSTTPRPATSTRVPSPRTPASGDALDRRRRKVAERHAARREVGAAVRAHLERERARAPASTSGASAPLAAALRRHRRRQELQREDNIKAFMSVVSTQAIGSSTATYARALARSLS